MRKTDIEIANEDIKELQDDLLATHKEIDNLEAENHKLKLTMRLHGGDCCSLANEVELFRGHWKDAEERCDELQKKLEGLE